MSEVININRLPLRVRERIERVVQELQNANPGDTYPIGDGKFLQLENNNLVITEQSIPTKRLSSIQSRNRVWMKCNLLVSVDDESELERRIRGIIPKCSYRFSQALPVGEAIVNNRQFDEMKERWSYQVTSNGTVPEITNMKHLQDNQFVSWRWLNNSYTVQYVYFVQGEDNITKLYEELRYKEISRIASRFPPGSPLGEIIDNAIDHEMFIDLIERGKLSGEEFQLSDAFVNLIEQVEYTHTNKGITWKKLREYGGEGLRNIILNRE